MKIPSHPPASFSRRDFLALTAASGALLGHSVGAATAERFLGLTVMPEYIQNEGVASVLQSLRRAGATAVATSPYVMEAVDERSGNREPPDDAGAGNVRLLDRPLWGQRALFVRTAPSFTPDARLYQGLRYQPSTPNDLTKRAGPVVKEFVRAAKAEGLKVYLQVQAAIPPGYRVQFGGPQEDDRARLPDGRIPPRRLANNGSLASPHIRAYTAALLRDLCRVYPEIDGIRTDWPEYPPYFLDDLFLDFSTHAEQAAARLGLDFKRMRAQASDFYHTLHGGLSDTDLARWREGDGGRYHLLKYVMDHPGLADLLRFKALLVDELLAGFRQTLTDAGGTGKELMPNAFPPPFALLAGMDYARAAKHSTALSVKLYTMHWPLILRFYGDALMKANPKLSGTMVAQVLAQLLDIADGAGLPRLSDYRYPEPDEPHPVGAEAQARKIRQAEADAGAVPVYAIAHGYGPLGDFQRRLSTAWQASQHGIWINRYGYLSDAKLDVIRAVCQR